MSKSVKGIQGQLLEVNVIGCRNLSDKEWFSRQDPYVLVEYGSTRFRTRTHTDGGKNPTFNEKFQIPLIEGLRELNVQVWNSNTLSLDDHIGSTRVLLDRVLSTGYDNTPWQLKSKSLKTSGEVNLILHFAGGGKKNDHGGGHGQQGSHSGHPCVAMAGYPPTAPPPAHVTPSAYPAALGSYPPPSAVSAYPAVQGYPPAVQGYPPASSYPGPPSGYPAPPPASSYPAGYPPPGYPPAPAPNPAPYPAPSGYPPVAPYPGHKAGKVHVGNSSHGSHGSYKHGKHKKHKGYKFGKKFKGWDKGGKGKKK